MLAYLRALLALWCLVQLGVASGTDTYVLEVKDPSPNLITRDMLTKAGHPGFFHVTGHAEPAIRVEVHIRYYSDRCGGWNYDWPRISLYRRFVYRPSTERYAILLSGTYENKADSMSQLCTWRVSDIWVSAYRRTEGDLLGVVQFDRQDRAPYVSDPRPIPKEISLTCNREAAPLHDWKPRCRYAPVGSAYTHFLLGDDHSQLVRGADGTHMVKVPIEVSFRLND